MSEKIEAVAEVRANVSAEQLFDAWLDPAKVRAWMAAALQEMGLEGDIRAVEIDAREGGRFLFADQRGEAEARHWGVYRAVDRPGRIEFTWITDPADERDPSVVMLTITADGENCLARIVHTIDARWAEYAPRISASWERMLRHAAEIA
ncbi:SRPBCC domain-containing protein [bacterium]|nr:SRPBCC domain-containing protein [bacterium]